MTSLRGFFREFAAVATSSVWPIKKATDYFSLGETPFRLNRGSGGVFTKGYFVPSGPFPEEYVVLERHQLTAVIAKGPLDIANNPFRRMVSQAVFPSANHPLPRRVAIIAVRALIGTIMYY